MSRSKLFIGIDIGLTGMKAIAFDERGVVRFEARRASPQDIPQPHWVERKGADFWAAVSGMCSDLMADVNAVGGYEIGVVAIDAHGDGAWLVDKNGDEIRPGVLSLDTRGIATAAKLNAEHEEDLLRVTGQNVGPASPGTIMKWLWENEPENVERADYFILAHDFLRTQFTGTIGVDLTTASQSFTDVNTQEYADEAFEIYGLEVLKDKKPPIQSSGEVAGAVTKKAAAETGIPEGTPVIAGMHDVDAGTVGIGAVKPGQMALMAGTWSMNVVISDAPKVSPDWFARAFVNKGEWLNMSISPAGASNLEWYVANLAKVEHDVLKNSGVNPYAFIDHEVGQLGVGDDYITFIPYLYGNPMGIDASGTFAGIRAWHTRGNMLRAIYEALAFNHWHHSEPLIKGFDVTDVRVSGGVAQSKRWPQILANTFGMRIGLPTSGESGALGAAMVGAVAVGEFKDLAEANDAMGADMSFVDPQEDQVEIMRERYARYRDLIEKLRPWWAEDKK